MDIPAPKQPTNHLKDRVLRFKPICFIKKNLPIFVVIFVFLLTLLFGLWNIRYYTITDRDGDNIPTNVENQIEKYLNEKVIGKNYFSFSTTSLEEEMTKNLSYVKSVNIEKVVPNKLEIFVNIYEPSSAAYIKNQSCYILSEEGYVLENICKEDTQNCCLKYATDNSIYSFTSQNVDISTEGSGKQKLMIMDNISNVTKVVRAYKYNIKNVTLSDSILEITLDSGQLFRFSIAEELDIQLERFIAVANKVKSDNLEFKSIDFRFERPVLKS